MTLQVYPKEDFLERLTFPTFLEEEDEHSQFDVDDKDENIAEDVYGNPYEEIDELQDSAFNDEEEPDREALLSPELKYEDEDLNTINVNNIVKLYFKQVASEPLLTSEEEVELARCIERGEKARRTFASRNYKAEEVSILRQSIEEETAARERLIKSNSRLVISVAKKYIGRGLPFIDLIQEGNIGLMRAAKKFDYKLGLKFSTYATWWIRQAVTRSISNDSRTIRLPVQLGDQINKLKQTENVLLQDLGRTPTDEEIAVHMDILPSKVVALKQLGWQPASLEAPVFDDEESAFGDFIEDNETPAPEDTAFSNLAREYVWEALKTLPTKEVHILQMRYGLLDGKIYTLAEIGRELGVTRERVRQIESRALKRLRSPKMKHFLQTFTT